MDPRMRPLNFFMAGCCIAMAGYAWFNLDRTAAFLWCACAGTFLAFTVREK